MRPLLPLLLLLPACGGLQAPPKGTPTPSDDDGIVGDDDTTIGDDDDISTGDDDDDTTGDDDDDDTTGDDDDDTTGDDDDDTAGDDDDDTTGDDDDDVTPSDSDGDGVLDADDVCDGYDDTVDPDGDGVPTGCDPCPDDSPDDTDGDGVCDSDDPCPLDDPDDTDTDGICDSDDPCPLDRLDDVDYDGVCDSDDPCPYDNPDDTDGDGVCQRDDPCPLDNPDDTDGDGVCDSVDLCPGEDDALCDIDGDGFAPPDGDCCETIADCGEPARVNPAAIEAQTAYGEIPVDDDCDGLIDELPVACDAGLLLDDTDPASALAAIGLCDTQPVLSSGYVSADGTPASPTVEVGLMQTFGTNVTPREGSSFLVLSTGHARVPSDPDDCGDETCFTFGSGTPEAGFPQTVPGCLQGTDIFDDIGLELQLKAPSNAVGYAFNFTFYTFEYPEWVCSTFNDQYITWVDPAPYGAINGNISFDADTNPVSVNIAYFDVCDGCAQGTSELVGTGFDTWDDAGATGWLQTTAPVNPGDTFTIRFTLWDTGDGELDSTVLIDDFQWILEGSPGVETVVDQ